MLGKNIGEKFFDMNLGNDFGQDNKSTGNKNKQVRLYLLNSFLNSIKVYIKTAKKKGWATKCKCSL